MRPKTHLSPLTLRILSGASRDVDGRVADRQYPSSVLQLVVRRHATCTAEVHRRWWNLTLQEKGSDSLQTEVITSAKALVTTPGWFLLQIFFVEFSRVASRGFFLKSTRDSWGESVCVCAE